MIYRMVVRIIKNRTVWKMDQLGASSRCQ